MHDESPEQRRERIRAHFSRYADPELVDDILDPKNQEPPLFRPQQFHFLLCLVRKDPSHDLRNNLERVGRSIENRKQYLWTVTGSLLSGYTMFGKRPEDPGELIQEILTNLGEQVRIVSGNRLGEFGFLTTEHRSFTLHLTPDFDHLLEELCRIPWGTAAVVPCVPR